MTRFRSALLAGIINLGVALPLFTGCSAAQKREEKAVLVCAGDELAQVIAAPVIACKTIIANQTLAYAA
jgi:formate-dependent nitrite reductase membrane component NrfD